MSAKNQFLRSLAFFYLMFSLVVNCLVAQSQKKSYDPERLQRIREYQQELVDHGITGSNVALVFMNGEVIYRETVNSSQKGASEISDNSIFPIWSMTKPITTVGAMILYEQGAFMLDDPLEKYLPEMKNLRCKDKNDDTYVCKATLTVKHILTHRSGWSYYPMETEGKPLLITDTIYNDLEDFSSKIASTPLLHEPGSQYTYGVNTALVGRLIESITGQSLYAFLKRNIFDPLDMPNTKFYLTEEEREYFQPLLRITDESSEFYKSEFDELSYQKGSRVQLGGEGLLSTPEDYSHFCEMLLNGGVYRGVRILSPAAIELMHMPHTTEVESDLPGFSFGFSFFHLQFPVKDGFLSPEGIFGWSGYHNTHFWIDRKNNLFGLFMTRRMPHSNEIRNNFRRAVYQAIY